MARTRINRRLPAPRGPLATAVLMVLLILVILQTWRHEWSEPRPHAPPAHAEGYLFCLWNVENLFDDHDDPKNHDPLENWFARDPRALALKHERLADVLLDLNGGLGPDILGLVEVENRRAVELLRDVLNARLPSDWHYDGLVHHDNISGRRIEPAILTRLPTRRNLERLRFDAQRIIQGHIEVDGAPLVVLVSHWTSRATDRTGERRAVYGQAVYDAYHEVERLDPRTDADVLVAGDFNDEPGDPSVRQHLRAVSDVDWVRARTPQEPPLLWNLSARLNPERDGTYFYNGRWQVLDQIAVSRGLLDETGWQVRPETLHVVNGPSVRFGRDRRPWRFGNETNPNPRGYSDHFPVTVRLRVHPDRTATGWETVAGEDGGAATAVPGRGEGTGKTTDLGPRRGNPDPPG